MAYRLTHLLAIERVGPSHYRAARQETDEQKSLRLLRQEFKRLGWKEDELQARRKGDKDKMGWFSGCGRKRR